LNPHARSASSATLCFGSNGSPLLSSRKYAKNSSRRCATIFGSSVRIVPAAAFLGFAARACPAASRSAFIASNAICGSTTSPRTSKLPPAGIPAAFSFAAETPSGTDRIVRTFVVTSSPVAPSPRVNPRRSVTPAASVTAPDRFFSSVTGPVS